LGFAFLTNLLVTQMLLLGGAAAVHQFTGMHVWAAAALIPVGVIIYTMMGGLRYDLGLCVAMVWREVADGSSS
jgi:Na+/proline symporter